MDASSLTRRVLARFHHAGLLRRVVSRHVEAAVITPEKLNELLLKVRKGATSTFSWKNIADVITHLGGKVTKAVGLVPVEKGSFSGDTEAEAAGKRSVLEKSVVPSLPSNPKHGQLYLTQLTPVAQGHYKDWEFEYEGAMGNEGWQIVMPDGKTRMALPSKWDVGNVQHGWRMIPAAKVSIYDTLDWLKKEAHWDALASEALKMEVHEPAVPRTRESTGSCGVCFQNVKIKPGDPPIIVLHGYKRPGTGQVHGNCFGMGYPPFELSVAATKAWLVKALIPSHARSVEALKDLESGVVTELEKHGRKYKVGDPGWEPELRGSILEAERNVHFAWAEVGVFEALVRGWKVRPLPQEGARHINWYFEGQK